MSYVCFFRVQLNGCWTLKKIKDSGSIALGHRESSIPFSYYDDKQQVVGYSQELMLKVVDAVKAELKLPTSTVKLTPVTSPTASRWCRTAPSTSSAAPPPTTPSAPARSASPTPSSSSAPPDDQEGFRHQGLPDLAGKNVVTTAGTTSERLVRKMNEDKKLA
jgi:glutamate/aspartate transport system substrate-binding protein